MKYRPVLSRPFRSGSIAFVGSCWLLSHFFHTFFTLLSLFRVFFLFHPFSDPVLIEALGRAHERAGLPDWSGGAGWTGWTGWVEPCCYESRYQEIARWCAGSWARRATQSDVMTVREMRRALVAFVLKQPLTFHRHFR